MTKERLNKTFLKAGKLLFCDDLNAEYVIDNKTCQGTAFMYYKREKHIDEQKRIQERFRLHDMLKMALYDYVDYIEFEPPEPMSYTDKYDIVKVVFEMGLKTK